MKLGIHNLHYKKVPFSNTILFPDVPTFPRRFPREFYSKHIQQGPQSQQ